MMTMQRMGKRVAVLSALLLTLALLPAAAFAGNLEPTAPPGPTMKTLDQIPPTWSQKLPAAQRFELVLDDEAVLDKETGLVWARKPGVQRSWYDASIYLTRLQIGGRLGWRLPTIEELTSLVDKSAADYLKLPAGHPFQPQFSTPYYWSSSFLRLTTDRAWFVDISTGDASFGFLSEVLLIWPVRGGQ